MGDRNAALVDPDEWGSVADPDRLERRYYAADWRGRVVALVTAAGEQAESYRYTANGVPIGIPLGDVNGDGKVENGATEEDWQQAYWWENNFGPYEARLDLNLDGSVNATDIGLVGSQTPGTMPTARASAASVGNRMFGSARVDREAVLGREGDYRMVTASEALSASCAQVSTTASTAIGVAACEAAIRGGLSKCSPSVRRLLDSVSSCPNTLCSAVTIDCVASANDQWCKDYPNTHGYVDSLTDPCRVVICAENVPKTADLCALLAHELVHVYDFSCKKIGLSCDERACTEIRAYTFQCNTWRARGYSSYRACIREMAWGSVQIDTSCTIADVDRNLDRCMLTSENPGEWNPPKPKPKSKRI